MKKPNYHLKFLLSEHNRLFGLGCIVLSGLIGALTGKPSALWSGPILFLTGNALAFVTGFMTSPYWMSIVDKELESATESERLTSLLQSVSYSSRNMGIGEAYLDQYLGMKKKASELKVFALETNSSVTAHQISELEKSTYQYLRILRAWQLGKQANSSGYSLKQNHLDSMAQDGNSNKLQKALEEYSQAEKLQADHKQHMALLEAKLDVMPVKFNAIYLRVIADPNSSQTGQYLENALAELQARDELDSIVDDDLTEIGKLISSARAQEVSTNTKKPIIKKQRIGN